jgi:hypothetical protein
MAAEDRFKCSCGLAYAWYGRQSRNLGKRYETIRAIIDKKANPVVRPILQFFTLRAGGLKLTHIRRRPRYNPHRFSEFRSQFCHVRLPTQTALLQPLIKPSSDRILVCHADQSIAGSRMRARVRSGFFRAAFGRTPPAGCRWCMKIGGLIGHFPDDSETSVDSSDFAASLEARTRDVVCVSSEHFGQLAWQFKRMSGSSGLKVQAAIACTDAGEGINP